MTERLEKSLSIHFYIFPHYGQWIETRSHYVLGVTATYKLLKQLTNTNDCSLVTNIIAKFDFPTMSTEVFKKAKYLKWLLSYWICILLWFFLRKGQVVDRHELPAFECAKKKNFNEFNGMFLVNKTECLYSDVKQYISLIVIFINSHKFKID